MWAMFVRILALIILSAITALAGFPFRIVYEIDWGIYGNDFVAYILNVLTWLVIWFVIFVLKHRWKARDFWFRLIYIILIIALIQVLLLAKTGKFFSDYTHELYWSI